MNIEIEAKMHLAEPETIIQRLEELDAEPVARLLEVNTYFDTDQRSLKAGDRGLRIRVENPESGEPRAIITHKGPRAHGQLKSRSETEVGITDAQAGSRLLRELGYLPVLSFEKRRHRWRLGACLVELDTLPHLGHFIEIEGPSDTAVLDVREKLGLKETPLVRASYIALLTTYLRENHIQDSVIRFEPETGGRNGDGG
ncbi:MAG: class IV adenylate cyclase [Phycisphaeraceae bacterium]